MVGLLTIFKNENVEGIYQCRLNAGMAAARKPCTVTCWWLVLHTVSYTLGAGHVVIFYAHITWQHTAKTGDSTSVLEDACTANDGIM